MNYHYPYYKRTHSSEILQAFSYPEILQASSYPEILQASSHSEIRPVSSYSVLRPGSCRAFECVQIAMMLEMKLVRSKHEMQLARI